MNSWISFGLTFQSKKASVSIPENAVPTQLSAPGTGHSFPLWVSHSLFTSDRSGIPFIEMNSAPLELSSICLYSSI